MFSLAFHKKNEYDIIVCGMNKTRKRINELVRRARGFGGEIPEVGEKIVCLQNTYVGGGSTRINNGELFTVEASFPGEVVSKFIISSEDSVDSGDWITVNVLNDCWSSEFSGKLHGDIPICTFGFGYCMSCHKVQGSTFGRVLFVDEDVSFFLEQQRFRYTGITRAAQHLMVAI